MWKPPVFVYFRVCSLQAIYKFQWSLQFLCFVGLICGDYRISLSYSISLIYLTAFFFYTNFFRVFCKFFSSIWKKKKRSNKEWNKEIAECCVHYFYISTNLYFIHKNQIQIYVNGKTLKNHSPFDAGSVFSCVYLFWFAVCRWIELRESEKYYHSYDRCEFDCLLSMYLPLIWYTYM